MHFQLRKTSRTNISLSIYFYIMAPLNSAGIHEVKTLRVLCWHAIQPTGWRSIIFFWRHDPLPRNLLTPGLGRSAWTLVIIKQTFLPQTEECCRILYSKHLFYLFHWTGEKFQTKMESFDANIQKFTFHLKVQWFSYVFFFIRWLVQFPMDYGTFANATKIQQSFFIDPSKLWLIILG